MSQILSRAAALLAVIAAAAAAARPLAGATAPPETLRSVAALPAHVAGQFEQLTACHQSARGVYFVFDRRAHSVYTLAPGADKPQKLIEIGTETGRVIDPTTFDLASDGTFLIADAPRGRPRIQVFTAGGSTLRGFFLQGSAIPRITFRNLVLNGIGSVEYTGDSVFLSQPELDALIVEYAADGRTVRMFGSLRRTGHEADREVHLALNSGLVIANPKGGFYFVFLAGIPQFRKYDAKGTLLFERHIEGVELDRFVGELPTAWRRQRTDAGEFPLVLPSVLAAAADSRGSLWVSLAPGVTYVYDANGEKRRTIQFHAAGPVVPTALSFTPKGQLLVTPGCFAFDPD